MKGQIIKISTGEEYLILDEKNQSKNISIGK